MENEFKYIHNLQPHHVLDRLSCLDGRIDGADSGGLKAQSCYRQDRLSPEQCRQMSDDGKRHLAVCQEDEF
jgi:hypothetical protein